MIKQLVAVPIGDQKEIMRAALSRGRKRRGDCQEAAEPMASKTNVDGKRAKRSASDLVENAKQVLSVMEAVPKPADAVMSQERNGLNNTLTNLINRVCAKDEVSMKHVSSCINRSVRLLSEGQLKALQRLIQKDSADPARWSKVTSTIDQELIKTERDRVKKRQSEERQQQQSKLAKQSKKQFSPYDSHRTHESLQSAHMPNNYSAMQYNSPPPPYNSPSHYQPLYHAAQAQPAHAQQHNLGSQYLSAPFDQGGMSQNNYTMQQPVGGYTAPLMPGHQGC